MGSFTLSTKDVQEIEGEVLALLPTPNGGVTLENKLTSSRAELAEDGSVTANGRSTFVFSNGQTIRANWHLRYAGLERMIFVDPEEVEEKK